MTNTPSPSFISILIKVGFFVLFFLSSCSTPSSVNQSTLSPADQANRTKTPSVSQLTRTVTETSPIQTNTPTGCTEKKGSVINRSFPSKILKEDFSFKIYLPPCYVSNPDLLYSVLYMLHGQTSLDDQWVRIGIFSKMDELLAENKVRPFLIVLPSETRSNIDSYVSPYGDAIVEELLPYMEKHFHTCTKRECRAIGGLSRGGNWAVHLGVEHPELFAAIGAHSAPLFYTEINNILRISEDEEALKNLPVFYIDAGNKDEDLEDVQLFNDTLREYNIQHEYYLFQGFHDEEYWSSHLQDYLLWYDSFLEPSQNSKN